MVLYPLTEMLPDNKPKVRSSEPVSGQLGMVLVEAGVATKSNTDSGRKDGRAQWLLDPIRNKYRKA
jgi:hypothetical protein